MPAYVIANVLVKDTERYPEYSRQVPATIEPFGGRFLARGGQVEVLEGSFQPHRFVIIEFPSVEQAKAWHDSDIYAAPKRLRQETSEGDLIVVEGVPPA